LLLLRYDAVIFIEWFQMLWRNIVRFVHWGWLMQWCRNASQKTWIFSIWLPANKLHYVIRYLMTFCATSYGSFIRYNGPHALCLFSLMVQYHASLYLHQHIILMPSSLCAKEEVWCTDSLYFLCVQPPVKCLFVTQIVPACRVWIWMLMHPTNRKCVFNSCFTGVWMYPKVVNYIVFSISLLVHLGIQTLWN